MEASLEYPGVYNTVLYAYTVIFNISGTVTYCTIWKTNDITIWNIASYNIIIKRYRTAYSSGVYNLMKTYFQLRYSIFQYITFIWNVLDFEISDGIIVQKTLLVFKFLWPGICIYGLSGCD
jgi:hypothetical protein